MLLAVLAAAQIRVSAQAVSVDTAGGVLRVHASGFSFLTGEPLARLKDGRSVRVELVAAVLAAPGKSAAAATRRIFALSYDLWEERFAVTAVDERSRSVSHLTAAAAEAWCVEQLTVPIRALGGLGQGLPFWIRLEYRILNVEPAQDPPDSGYTLQALIDALSRRRKTESSMHTFEAGPFKVPPGGSPSMR